MKRSRIPSLSSTSSSFSSGATSSPSHATKYTTLNTSPSNATTGMRCTLPPHEPLSFPDPKAFEEHYLSVHTHRCSDCHKNFPSAHYLDLHIAENHDPITATLRDAGERTFACFVEDCEKTCSDWMRRRNHLIDKHGFPRNYDFFVINDGVDAKRSLLRPGVDRNGHRKSSRDRGPRGGRAEGQKSDERPGETDDIHRTERGRESRAEENGKEETCREDSAISEASALSTRNLDDVNQGSPKASINSANDPMEDIAASFKALNMVPRSITFGQRRGKAGFAKK